MRVPVYSAQGDKVVGYAERSEPVCGEDFCDLCGDCLACYGDQPYPDGGAHRWLYYEDQLPPDVTVVRTA